MRKSIISVAAACLLSFVSAIAFAQSMGSWNVFQQNGIQSFSRSNSSLGLLYSLGISKFFNSYVNWEIKRPNIPDDPCSRIEYPLDQWFAGIGAQYGMPNWAFAVQCWLPISYFSQTPFQDSDWGQIGGTPYDVPGKTVFLEMDSKIKGGSFLLDAAVQGPTLPQTGFLIPVFGYRHQSFSFEAFDGFIKYFVRSGRLDRDLPGLNFDNTTLFQHYYLGGLLNFPAIAAGRVSTLGLTLQADAAWVNATMNEFRPWMNTDITLDKATGWCYHLAGNCKYAMLGTFNLDFGIDFKRIYTAEGDWLPVTSGVQSPTRQGRLISDQLSVSGSVGYLF